MTANKILAKVGVLLSEHQERKDPWEVVSSVAWLAALADAAEARDIHALGKILLALADQPREERKRIAEKLGVALLYWDTDQRQEAVNRLISEVE